MFCFVKKAEHKDWCSEAEGWVEAHKSFQFPGVSMLLLLMGSLPGFEVYYLSHLGQRAFTQGLH